VRPGRTRQRLAALLSDHFNVVLSPLAIRQNNYPAARELDLCRWYADIHFSDRGLTVFVYSWDTMADILKYGIATVNDESTRIQVCANEGK
jgi:hypothetical protein